VRDRGAVLRTVVEELTRVEAEPEVLGSVPAGGLNLGAALGRRRRASPEMTTMVKVRDLGSETGLGQNCQRNRAGVPVSINRSMTLRASIHETSFCSKRDYLSHTGIDIHPRAR
jgi:hypothetical protein